MCAALSQVVADADHLARILDRMLAADSRADRDPPEQLIGLIPRLAERWRRQAQAAGLQLNVRTAAGPDGAAAVSGRELAAIIDPLVENAMQHTPAGGSVEVRVTANAAEINAQVVNTGSGVAPDLRDRLFEPWVSSRSASSAGGLGLWLARETARAAGGEVWLTDPANGHTAFSVRLPAALSDAPRET
jgi:signal transduction histidine kinase